MLNKDIFCYLFDCDIPSHMNSDIFIWKNASKIKFWSNFTLLDRPYLINTGNCQGNMKLN